MDPSLAKAGERGAPDRMSDWIVLTGRETSLVLEASSDGFPIWRHWGAKVAVGDGTPTWSASTPRPTFSLDVNQPLRLVPTFGNGWMGPSALLCHRGGFDWAPGQQHIEIEPGVHSVTCSLRDDVAGLVLQQTLRLDPLTDVLTMASKLTNMGEEVLDVTWLAAGTLPLPAQAACVESLSGRHNSEYVPVRDRLSQSSWRRENRRGITSHDCPPFASVLAGNAGQDSGAVWAAQLAWSGNHCQSIDWHEDGRWIWMAGAWLAPGEVRLERGESLLSPEWLATYSPCGRDGVARNFHAELRKRSPMWRSNTLKPRPVHINTWEGFYFDHDESELVKLADVAAELGVERFVLDDGWFKGRHDDTRALGDWAPDHGKYPQGLKPLADHVTRLGMEFGLWVEPEMVNPDSDLYRAHPDWVLQLPPSPLLTARNQLILDLTREDVKQHLFTTLDGLLKKLPISYLKWDHNRDLTQAGTAGRPAYRRQVLGAYDLIDAVRARHPHVEIEACAGGGGRIDAGILARSDRVWTSDCLDAVSRIGMHRHFLRYFPPEIMGAHIGASPSHATGRSQPMSFRAAAALPGHFGLELDPRKLSDRDNAKIRDWIAFYKAIRHRIHTGEVWQGEAVDGLTWLALGTVRAFILFVYRMQPTQLRFPPSLSLPFLAADAAYALTRKDPGAQLTGNDETIAFRNPGDSVWLTGSWLMQVGLQVPFMKAETCIVLEGQLVS